jgi:hypothetical protein
VRLPVERRGRPQHRSSPAVVHGMMRPLRAPLLLLVAVSASQTDRVDCRGRGRNDTTISLGFFRGAALHVRTTDPNVRELQLPDHVKGKVPDPKRPAPLAPTHNPAADA